MRPAADAWLSDVLGVPVFALRGPGPLDQARLHALRDHVAAQTSAIYAAKIEPRDTAALRGLASLGFYVVDVNVRLAHRGHVPAAPASDGRIRAAAASDESAVVELAGRSFTCSRFHLDPAIPRPLADDVKRAWAASYFRGKRGEAMLIAEQAGHIAGFLQVLPDADGKIIDLIAVAPEAQRKGIGRSLIAAFLANYRREGVALQVGTQMANGPSLRLYQGMGFAVEQALVVLHRHVPERSAFIADAEPAIATGRALPKR